MVSTLNDAKLYALRAALVVTSGQITQLTKDWLLSLGAVGETVNNLWMDYLLNVAVPAPTPGQLNDMQYDWLGLLGFTGALNDRWLQYWLGVQSDSPNILAEFGELLFDESGAVLEIE